MWNSSYWKHWRVVVKLDPDKVLPRSPLSIIVEKSPDAIIVGGTQGITAGNTLQLVGELRRGGYTGTIVQEISNSAAVIDGVDAHLVPVVLNAGSPEWIAGQQQRALKKFKKFINWGKILAVGYIVCNPDSAVGRLTGALPVDEEDAAAYALYAGRLLGIPVVYIEYSGVYGSPYLVKAARSELNALHVMYGGGITGASQAAAMLDIADTVVVGNAVYEAPEVLPGILDYARRA